MHRSGVGGAAGMTIEEFLSNLHRVRRSGDGWAACCPAHDDRSPSLSVSVRGGKILVHCFAGCSVQAICAALGLGLRDLFEESIKRTPELPIVRAAHRVAAEG